MLKILIFCFLLKLLQKLGLMPKKILQMQQYVFMKIILNIKIFIVILKKTMEKQVQDNLLKFIFFIKNLLKKENIKN